MTPLPIAPGTTPPAAVGEVQAAAWVQRMFGQIAPRYDLLNHLLSFNIDRRWRRILLQALQPVLENPHALVLDLCCGTADVLLEFQRAARARVLGADFSHPMLVEARHKIQLRSLTNPLLEADALTLPLANASLDAIAVSFGFRNLANYRAGLAELYRVVKPGGQLAILEFSHPPNFFIRSIYRFYSRFILPRVGALVSGSREAYAYLPESIQKFPDAPALKTLALHAGFGPVHYRLLTFGIAALHIAIKPSGNAAIAESVPPDGR